MLSTTNGAWNCPPMSDQMIADQLCVVLTFAKILHFLNASFYLSDICWESCWDQLFYVVFLWELTRYLGVNTNLNQFLIISKVRIGLKRCQLRCGQFESRIKLNWLLIFKIYLLLYLTNYVLLSICTLKIKLTNIGILKT